MEVIAVMDRVGGWLAYQALCEDARAYDLVLVAMAGEADAARIRQLEAKRRAK